MHALTRLTARLTRRSTRGAMLLSTLAATSSVLALVIWIKLRVVTHVPRTAYADPQDERQAQVGPVRDEATEPVLKGESAAVDESVDAMN